MYSLNWHRSFDVCKLVDARRRGRCECFLSLTLVWLDASTRADALGVNGALGLVTAAIIAIVYPEPIVRWRVFTKFGTVLEFIWRTLWTVTSVSTISSGIKGRGQNFHLTSHWFRRSPLIQCCTTTLHVIFELLGARPSDVHETITFIISSNVLSL